ncbi:MAG: hypothetical protein JWN25_3459 [Verrucomicrobiales bacterium]|nr:hypothetical protein [Verrucomicrobiales bacterium]MDB6130086.1 hypothetical protein [Verrucomicrobiales bacterium]
MLKLVYRLLQARLPSRKAALLVFAIAQIVWPTVCLATPIIEKQPISKIDIQLGSELELEVDAKSDNGILNYQWQLNGVDILNETNSVLKIDHLLAQLSGSYTVVVDDGIEAITSIPVNITTDLFLATRNDLFSNRYDLLTVLGGTIRSKNNDAGVEPNEPLHNGKPASHSVWFRWIAPASGIVTFDTKGSAFDTVLDVFQGSSVSKLSMVQTGENDDDGGGFLTSELKFNAMALNEYAIRIDGYAGSTGEIVLNWSFEPTLDTLPFVLFKPGIKTVGPGFSLDLSVDWLNGDSCEWLVNGKGSGNKTKFFSFGKITEDDVGFYSVKVKNSKRDSQTQPAELQINLRDDGSTDPTSFAFNKLNDAFLDAQKKRLNKLNSVSLFGFIPWHIVPLDGGGTSSGYSTTQIFNTLASTKEPGEPNHCGVAGGASEWYNFQPAFNGTVKVTTDGSNYETVLAVYTGPGDSFSTLVPLVCNNSKFPQGDNVHFQANSNTVYYIAIDGVNGARGTAKLNIFLGNPPVVSSGPQATNVLLNASTTLSVSATGSTPIFYQWQLNGVSLANATNASLTITNFQSGNSGNYTVLVSNKVDVATSSALVTLASAPQIQTITGTQTVNPGGTINLLTTVTANPFADLQWYFKSTPLQSRTSFNLLLTNFSASNEGLYWLVATNMAGAVTSAPVQLSLSLPLRLSSYGTSNGVSFNLHSIGLSNTNVVVLTSSNLVNWTPLCTNLSLSGFLDFSDPLTNGTVPRFYQFKIQP